MDYTLVQARADRDTVLSAFGEYAPGRELTEVAYERGWTTARLDPRVAAGFAAALARRVGSGVLVVTVAGELRASLFTADGDTVEALDRPGQLVRLCTAFRRDHPGSSDVDLPKSAGESPRHRHVALAALLGVPDAVPGTLGATIATPSARSEREYRRNRRIIAARGWLGFAAGLLLVAVIPVVIRGELLVVPVLAAGAGLLWLVRFVLGRRLPAYVRAGTSRR